MKKICAGCGRAFKDPPSRRKRYCSWSCYTNIDFHYETDKKTGCWNWLRHKDKKGYGKIWGRGPSTLAHRVFYERKYGPIPKGLQLDHTCRNTSCVNPDHTEPVTNRENHMRAPSVIAARKATHCPNGHKWTKANTYNHPKGSRVCRACTNEAQQRYRAKSVLGATP